MRERIAIHVEGDDVARGHHAGRNVARHQVSVRGIALVTDADVPEGVDDVEAEQDLVGEHEVIELDLGRAGEPGSSRLGTSVLVLRSLVLSNFGIHWHYPC